MEWIALLVEFLKVLLSAQVMAAAVCLFFFKMFKDDIKALILRIAKIRLPGGGEVSTPQLEKQIAENDLPNAPLPAPETKDQEIPATLDNSEVETIKALLNSERARAYFWEYRYLNYYLVYNTQRVLNWLSSVENKVSLMLFDTMWLPSIPSASERKAIISALENHHLIQIENELVTITPKGREYIEWRGLLPAPA
jgi:hypothetical protein